MTGADYVSIWVCSCNRPETCMSHASVFSSITREMYMMQCHPPYSGARCPYCRHPICPKHCILLATRLTVCARKTHLVNKACLPPSAISSLGCKGSHCGLASTAGTLFLPLLSLACKLQWDEVRRPTQQLQARECCSFGMVMFLRF